MILNRALHLIVRCIECLRKEGFVTFSKKLFAGVRGNLSGVASIVYSSREVTEIEINLEKFEPRFLQRSSMKVEFITEELLRSRSQDLPEDWAELLSDFQKKGYLSFWILSGRCVVGFVCFASGDYYVKDMALQLHLEKEEILLYGIFVEAAHRRKVTSGILMEEALLYLKAQGYFRVVAHIDLKNIPSLRYAKSNKFSEARRWKVAKSFGIVRSVRIQAVGDVLNPPRLNRAVKK